MKILSKIKCDQVQSKLHIVFYTILASLLILCIVQLYMIVRMGSKVKYKKSIPVLEIRPLINSSSNNALIWYNENDVTTVDKCIKLTDDFIQAYRMYPEPPNIAPMCDYGHPPRRSQICPLDFDNFGPCAAPFYGYYSFSPCIFLKLSKAYGWMPHYYKRSDNLPQTMPKDLTTAIRMKKRDTQHEGRRIWVSCEGEGDVDKESIEAIHYYPYRGFPSYYFPVKHINDEYSNPLIAVEIVNPKPGAIIKIKCRAWTKDIDRGSEEDQQKATVHFGIMREELSYEDEYLQNGDDRF